MKKFLSYLFTFIVMFAISATITIKVKSDILENGNPNKNANAEAQTTLLGGLMNALETNPKIDITGEANIVYDGTPATFGIDIQLNLATLTNPEIKGNLTLKSGDTVIDVLFTYVNKTVYVSYDNLNIKVDISNISQVIDLFKNIFSGSSESADLNTFDLTNTTTETEEQATDAFNISIDDLMEAVSNPTKIIVGDDLLFILDLTGICKVNLLVDSSYNLKNVSISEFVLLDNIEIDCNLNVVTDDKIEIIEPSEQENFLDVAAVSQAVAKIFTEDYTYANVWTSIYKDKSLFEHITSKVKFLNKEGIYSINSTLSGTLDGNFKIAYSNNSIFANLDNIFVKGNTEQLSELMKTISADGALDISAQSTQMITEVMDWFKNNYESLLNGIQVSQNQVKFVADMTGILGQTGEVSIILSLNQGEIDSIKLTNLNVLGYSITTSMYLQHPTKLVENIDSTKYYDCAKVIDIVNWVKNINVLDVSANLNLTYLDKLYSANIIASADIKNNSYSCLLASLFNADASIVYSNDCAYLKYGELMLKLDMQYVKDVLNVLDLDTSNFEQEFKDQIQKFVSIAKTLSLNDIVKMLNISVDANGISIDADLSIFVGKELTVKLNVDFENGFIVDDINIKFGDIKLSGNVNIANDTEQQIEFNPDLYVDLGFTKDHLLNIITAVKNKQFTGSGTFDVWAGSIELSGDYAVNYINGKISAELNTNLYGIDINVAFIDQTIYVCAAGLKVKANINQIDDIIAWLNETFNLNISLDFDVSGLITDFSLSDITNFIIANNSISATVKDINLNVNFSDDILIDITNDAFRAALTIGYEAKEIIIDQADYSDYSVITDFVDIIMQTATTKQLSFVANATIYEGTAVKYNAECNMQIDLVNAKMQASVSLTGQKNFQFNIAYFEDMWFVNYNNLKIKIHKNDIAEILAIVLEALGIDPSILPFLKDVVDGLDVNLGNIENIIPNIDFGNPLSMLGLIESIDLSNNTLKLTLDGKAITNYGDQMYVEVATNGDRLTALNAWNIYTGVTPTENFSLFVTLNQFTNVKELNPAEYLDFSGTNELIKALINTAGLNYFEINGSLKINGNLLGIDINWDVPINVKVKLDENRNPEIMMTIGVIPSLILVNNDVPFKTGDTSSGYDRMLYIYYKDGFVYFHRTEKIPIVFGIGNRTYEKKLKASVGEVFANILDYVQYGVGFTDAIMQAIRDSLALSEGHTPNLGNIINSFTAADSKNFNIQLNMYEITNDPKMGTMDIGIGVINNAETGGKNYIGNASMNIYMPLASAFQLTLYSNNLQLINIGKELDFTNLYSYVNSYTYNEGAEWEANNGSWSLASETKYTLTFETNSPTSVDNIVLAPGLSLNLPTLNDYIIDDGKTYNSRVFVGWYTSSDFTESSRFNQSTMPRKDLTLYAKWIDNVRTYYTLIYQTNCDLNIESLVALEGDSIFVNSLSTRQETIGQTTTTYSFGGWYTSPDFADSSLADLKTMPSNNVTLFAKWIVEKVEQTRLLQVYDNNNLIYSFYLKPESEIDFAAIPSYSNTSKFYLDANYQTLWNQNSMPDMDLELHISNLYSVTIASAYGDTTTYKYNLYQGDKIEMPNQATYVVDDGTKTLNTTYNFLGFDSIYDVMPNQNINITANWQVDVKHYYNVSFDLRWYLVLGCTAGSKMKSAPSAIAPIRVLEGTEIDLTTYAPTCTAYLTAIKIDAKKFTATSWGTSAWGNYTSGGSGFKSYVVTGDATLYACWERS